MLIRQTNIIWMLFVACTGVIEFAQSHLKDSVKIDDFTTSMVKEDMSANRKGVSEISNLRKRRVNNGAKSRKKITLETSVPMAQSSGYASFSYDPLMHQNGLYEPCK